MSTIVTRAGKGSALTHNEVDANFTNLNTDKLQSGNTAASLTITSADINGGTIDGTTIGGSSAAVGTFTTANATTVDTTNIEVTNIKAKDGTAAITIADSTGIVTGSTAQIIEVTDNTNAALRITQLGTGNALVVEDSTNPDATPFVIDTNGRVVSGHTSALAIGADAPNFQTNAGSSTNNGYGAINWTGSTGSSNFNLAKSRSTTIGSYSVVLSGDSLGKTKFFGDDGSAFIEAARIEAAVDGTPGTNDMPGRLVFSTTADGASTPTERMRIDSAGNVGIGITPTQKLHVSGNILATGSIDCGTQFLGLSTDSATAPSFSFAGDENTGMYRPGADQVALTVNGNARLTVSTSQFTGTLPWRGQNGTAAAPAFSASADTNTGIYFPGADRIGFAEGGVQVGEFDASSNFKFNSGYGSVATAYGCRAWVNFNGTGTVAIRASGNVSSITDNGTGDYTVNFTTAMPDANYAACVSGVQRQTASGTNQGFGYYSTDDVNATTYSTTAVRISNKIGSVTGFNDVNIVSVAIFR